MTVPEMSVEAWSARDMASLLNEAAHEYELVAAKIRALKDSVDAISNGSSNNRYTDVALDAQKIVDSAAYNSSLWRIAKVGSAADVDRAVRAATTH